MPKAEAARFSMVPRADVPRSAFDVRFDHKTTIGAEFLYPVYVDEVLPGDSLRLKMSALCRLATPIVPVMDDIVLESFFFFVPNRLVWSNWERFMGERASIADTTSFLIPQVTITDAWTAGRPEDYYGLQPPSAGQTYLVNALPWRAYDLIWNEWFRDQDLQDPLTVQLGDGPDTMTNYDLRRRGKRHDYFTSARPWPVKTNLTAATSAGQNLGVFLPGQDMNTVGTYNQAGAPVSGLGWPSSGGPTAVGGTEIRDSGLRTWTPTALMNTTTAIRMAATATGSTTWPDVRVLVNDIYTAVQVQNLLQRNARGGTRYVELVRAHFGVSSPDARLQRPEYLGGGRTYVTINPVAQTSETTANGVLGELAAIGTAVADHGFSASFVEHGFIIGLVSMRGNLTYQRGVNRMWFRRTVYDHYFPSLAHLGEQAILSKEIWTDGTSDDDLVFGYQERWAEYKYKPSITTGFMNGNNVGTPLDVWHLAQEFSSRPALNTAFVEDKTPLARVLQVAAFLNAQALLDASFQLRWVRPMPMFSIPGVGGRL